MNKEVPLKEIKKWIPAMKDAVTNYKTVMQAMSSATVSDGGASPNTIPDIKKIIKTLDVVVYLLEKINDEITAIEKEREVFKGNKSKAVNIIVASREELSDISFSKEIDKKIRTKYKTIISEIREMKFKNGSN